MIDTSRKYPRSLREAFPLDYRESAIGLTGPAVIRTRTPILLRVWQATARHREFVSVWWIYRKQHSWAYAARIAYGIAYEGASF